MKFYVIGRNDGEVVGCQTSLRRAKAEARSFGLEEYSVDVVDVPVTSETIRRLLGDLGGYADSAERVYTREVTP